jgi:hypothetical protein
MVTKRLRGNWLAISLTISSRPKILTRGTDPNSPSLRMADSREPFNVQKRLMFASLCNKRIAASINADYETLSGAAIAKRFA